MNRSRLSVAAIVACLLISTQVVAAGSQGQPLTAEMVVSLRRATQASLDPSGEWVAYTLSVPRDPDEGPGGAISQLWVVNLPSGETRRYTSGPASVSSVAWAPDGAKISFRTRRTAHSPNTQIYALPLHGGEAQPLTNHPTSVGSYRWSSDGSRIAFLATDAQSEEEKKAAQEGRDWQVFDQSYKFARVWVLDLESGDSRQLYDEPLNAWSLNWSADGSQILFQASPTPRIDDSYMFTQLYRVPATGGTPEQIAETPGKLGAPNASPDGSRVAFLAAVSANDPLAQSLFVKPATGGTAENLTEGYEGSVASVQWLDALTLLMLAQEGTITRLYRVDASDGERTEIDTEGRILQSVDARPETGRFVAIGHTASHPQEVYAGSLEGGELARVTVSNPDLESIQIARQESIEWQGAEGWRMTGVLTYPLDYQEGQRYPLVLQVHGGPEGISLDGWTTSATYPVQLLAANGYMVMLPNYRGSAGRGVAFSKGDHDDLGGTEYEDVLAGIDYLVDRGLVDGDRVGTGGWSYGGYFSGWAATRYSTRFKAAVMAAGIANWISFMGTTDIPYEMSVVHWNNWWFDEPALHWERSPLAHINVAQTPVLIVHGTSDARVHPGQSLELYTALRVKGVPTELVFYPRQPHGLVERAHQLDFAKRTLEWFDRYLK